MKRLADLGEFGLLERFRRTIRGGRGVEVGIGDDAAVVRAGGTRLVLTTDALIEDVHFRQGWDSPEGLGRRAFAVNASDLAAMGAAPRWALVSLAVPASAPVAALEGFTRGFARAAAALGCALVGGNLAEAAKWLVSVALVGELAAPPLLRRGARPGHALYVSGTLGGAARARELLLRGRGERRDTLAFRRPVPRVALGVALCRSRLASAAIDVSDGLLQDLGHLCEASGVGAVVSAERVPLARSLGALSRKRAVELALSGGEDYELLFTVPPSREAALARLDHRVRRIGEIVAGRRISVLDSRGREIALAGRGFDHFAGRAGKGGMKRSRRRGGPAAAASGAPVRRDLHHGIL